MVVDFHVHLGLPEHRVMRGNELESMHLAYLDFIQDMDKAGVAQAVVFPIPHRDYDVQKSNEYVLKAATESSGRLIPFCRIDNYLQSNLRSGFKGAKLHMGRGKNAKLSYENIEIKSIIPQLHILEDHSAPLILHASFKDKPKQVEQILEAAPNLFVVLAHCGRGNVLTTEQVLENAEVLKKHDRVYFETSTLEDPLTGEGKIIQRVCKILGSDRVLFGTDYPFLIEHCAYKQHIDYLLKIPLDEETKKKLFHDNAVKLLDLDSNSSRITIRRTNASDIPLLFNKFLAELPAQDKKHLALASKFKYREHWEKHIISGKSCFIALSQRTIVGYMRCFEGLKDKSSGDLWDFVVHPSFRNRGVAKQMLCYLHRRFLKMFTKTDANNVQMVGLLKRNGYATDNPTAPRVIKWYRK